MTSPVMSVFKMVLAAVFFLGLAVLGILIGMPLAVVVLAGVMGLVGVLAVPIAYGQARGDPRAGRSDRGYGALSSARGGYLALAVVGMSLFLLAGIGMLILGEPFDGDPPYSRYTPRTPLEARLIGAFVAALAAPGVVIGIRRLRA